MRGLFLVMQARSLISYKYNRSLKSVHIFVKSFLSTPLFCAVIAQILIYRLLTLQDYYDVGVNYSNRKYMNIII